MYGTGIECQGMEGTGIDDWKGMSGTGRECQGLE